MTKPITKLITLQAITFLHPGTGQTTGVVDLPIQREIHTEFPMLSSSGFKGSLRDKAEQLWNGGDEEDEKVTITFGDSTKNKQDAPAAGAMAITDARILAFPVRSLQQVFIWVTCPMVIQRLRRDAQLVGQALPQLPLLPKASKETALKVNGSKLESPLVLEEIAYQCKSAQEVNDIADFIVSILNEDSGFDKNRFVVLSDEDFKYHVKYGTQVSARIKLNENKSTGGGDGNLWYEETLPPETLMYAFALCHKPRKESNSLRHPQNVVDCLQELCADSYLQIGGNETVGQGWCSLKLNPESEAH